MGKYYGDFCISDGEYEKNGKKKKSWMKIGTVFQQEDSGSLSVYLPLFGKWANIFPKQDKSAQPQQQEPVYTQPGSQQQQYKNDDRDLPF